MTDWTTRIKPNFTQRFGVNELHIVCFEPPGWPGKGLKIALGSPEQQIACFGPDGRPVVLIDRPKNKGTKVSCALPAIRRPRTTPS